MSNAPRVLVVDDEAPIQKLLAAALGAAGYEHLRASSGAEGLSVLMSRRPEIVLLDLGLPDMDGKSVLKRARAFFQGPVLILSARDAEAEKIDSLDLGADDYVPKPFLTGELIARIGKALRRQAALAGAPARLSFGALELDLTGRRLLREGEAIGLTRREYRLLEKLALAPGGLMSHEALLEELWGPAHLDDIPYLRAVVSRLRHKLEPDPAAPRVLLTEPGVGYRLARPA